MKVRARLLSVICSVGRNKTQRRAHLIRRE
jgi:hypothetical protein